MPVGKVWYTFGMKKIFIIAVVLFIIIAVGLFIVYQQQTTNSNIRLNTIIVSTQDRNVSDERILEIANEVGAISSRRVSSYNFVHVKLPTPEEDALKKLATFPEVLDVVAVNYFGKKVDPAQINFKLNIGDTQINKIVDQIGGTIKDSSYTNVWEFTVIWNPFTGTANVYKVLEKLKKYPEIKASPNGIMRLIN